MFISKEKFEYWERQIVRHEAELSGLREGISKLLMQVTKLECENKFRYSEGKRPYTLDMARQIGLLGQRPAGSLPSTSTLVDSLTNSYNEISIKKAIKIIIDHAGVEFVKTSEIVTLEKKKKEKEDK